MMQTFNRLKSPSREDKFEGRIRCPRKTRRDGEGLIGRESGNQPRKSQRTPEETRLAALYELSLDGNIGKWSLGKELSRSSLKVLDLRSGKEGDSTDGKFFSCRPLQREESKLRCTSLSGAYLERAKAVLPGGTQKEAVRCRNTRVDDLRERPRGDPL